MRLVIGIKTPVQYYGDFNTNLSIYLPETKDTPFDEDSLQVIRKTLQTAIDEYITTNSNIVVKDIKKFAAYLFDYFEGKYLVGEVWFESTDISQSFIFTKHDVK